MGVEVDVGVGWGVLVFVGVAVEVSVVGVEVGVSIGKDSSWVAASDEGRFVGEAEAIHEPGSKVRVIIGSAKVGSGRGNSAVRGSAGVGSGAGGILTGGMSVGLDAATAGGVEVGSGILVVG